MWPKSGLIERDNNDARAIGALAYFYDGGTSTPKTVYQDAAETTPRTQPVTTDGNGRWPTVFIPYGAYKEVRTTTGGQSIGSSADNIPNPAPFDSTVVTDPLSLYQTGHISVGLGNETRDGFVRLNGRTIGNAASSATERANADTADLFTHIYNRCSDTAAPVSGGRGASAAADFAANKTIFLPSFRGAGLRGFDDMGNSAANLLASAPVVVGDTISPGSFLGANTHTLTTAQLPVVTPAGTITAISGTISSFTPANSINSFTPAGSVSITDPGHTHNINTSNVALTGGAIGASDLAGSANARSTVSNTTGITASFTGNSVTLSGSAVTPTFTFSSGTFSGTSFGSGSAHNNVARDGLVTFYIKL